jgi:hypothetical protein
MDTPQFNIHNSVTYTEFLAERDEILRHKWIESEKTGNDIGFERALIEWVTRYRSAWRACRERLRRGDCFTC